MKFVLALTVLFVLGNSLVAQTTITGKVTDETSGEELIYANLSVQKVGVFVTGTSTDFDGNYKINLDPGTYDLTISYLGFPNRQINGVIVNDNQNVVLDVQMRPGLEIISPIWTMTIRVLQLDEPSTKHHLSNQSIQKQPTRNISQLSMMLPGVALSQ